MPQWDEMRRVILHDDGSIYVFPHEAGTPPPQPTPAPTPPPNPNERVLQMPQDGTSTFLYFEAGVRYTFAVPGGMYGSVEIGEGQGAPASAGKMSLSDRVGDWSYGADPAKCIDNPRDPVNPRVC